MPAKRSSVGIVIVGKSSLPLMFNPMKIINCLLVFAFICVSFLAEAQSSKLRPLRSPKSRKTNNPTERKSGTRQIIKILEQGDEGIPLAFEWQLNADTVLKAGDVFKETIAFSGGAVLNWFMADDSVTLQRSTSKDYKVTSRFVRFSGETAAFDVTEENGVLVLENIKTHEKQRYKIFFDKTGKGITRMESIETTRIYVPARFEGGSLAE